MTVITRENTTGRESPVGYSSRPNYGQMPRCSVARLQRRTATTWAAVRSVGRNNDESGRAFAHAWR